MSEEIRNPGMEMNDTALEGASGGVRDSLVMHAEKVCAKCSYHCAGCKGGKAQLAEYMERHGTINWFGNCPFKPSNSK